jgi:ATP-dependent RNA circularization protein (DNA/RNA ligase family)
MIGDLKRPVRGVIGHFEKERRRGVVVDEPDRPLGDQVGHVAVGVNR